jgi:2-C-methyl-D-erythritol 4-phosphate cytidylyltransferase
VNDRGPLAAAIVLGAGAGRRLGAEEPKAFLTIGGRTILAMAAAAAAASPAIGWVVATAPSDFEDRAEGCLKELGVDAAIVTGGPTRQASVMAALGVLQPEVEIVAVHDAARPFAPPDLFTEVVKAVRLGALGAVPVMPVADTVKRVRDGMIVGTEDRQALAIAQTPQAFRANALLEAHAGAARSGVVVTDDATMLELDGPVRTVPGDPGNFKITTLLDLARAEARMGGEDG